ncbi:mitochondrial carrier domain-containing protein [Thamnocephalis sphaerospora]|uniref:Mitochondrial carrier domain-containing protein n=1 Tax=Thamnocephalis sphaerospora TaxID=78915 RepID=A0A4P9XTZ6_9FUNG|nr:mitochondrial carrier domain-containing protein [Thamnocephalis sphaerospora]|eukprot:RKP09663.1 mitochondrial carrier domain-containing protein [Thamnocephalis sphaerospora]
MAAATASVPNVGVHVGNGEHTLAAEHTGGSRVGIHAAHASAIARYPILGFLAGAIAACGAVTVTNPLEVVKTRMQLQGELGQLAAPNGQASGSGMAARAYPSTLSAMRTIARHEGARSLQKGLGAAYAYQVAMNGARLGMYEPTKRWLLRCNAQIRGVEIVHTSNGVDPVAVRVVAGGLAGAAGAVLGSPLYLVKTRLQSHSEHIRIGHQHQYRGTLHGLRAIFATEGGLRGLFRGADAAMMRAMVGSAVQLSTYDQCKAFVTQTLGLRNGWPAHTAASFITGVAVCCAMNPFDVVSTRVYNQAHDPVTGAGRLYRGPFDCLVKTVRAEGVRGLFKGLGAHYLRIGPHTVLTFVLLEQAKAAIETAWSRW